MTLKKYFDNIEEIFIGAVLQFPLYFITGWWILLIMPLCGLLWRLGGVEGGSKLFRRIGVPLVVCGATFLFLHQWTIFLAIPFMIWLCPASYGEKSWLYNFFYGLVVDVRKADFLTRGALFAWYWSIFGIALLINLG